MNEIQRNKILVRHIIAQGIAANQRDLGKLLGYTNESSFSQIINCKVERPKNFIEKMLGLVPNLNPEWLLTGEGEMLVGAEERPTTSHTTENYRSVPIIHIDSVGGIHSQNEILSPEYVEGYIPLTGARPDDIAIYQTGVSMSPTIPPGAILHLREVVDWREYIGYGDVFVLLLTDGRRITKEVRRYADDPENYVLCVSYNADPEPLPRKCIFKVWKVLKVLIDRGW